MASVNKVNTDAFPLLIKIHSSEVCGQENYKPHAIENESCYVQTLPWARPDHVTKCFTANRIPPQLGLL